VINFDPYVSASATAAVAAVHLGQNGKEIETRRDGLLMIKFGTGEQSPPRQAACPEPTLGQAGLRAVPLSVMALK